jgi:hypothetical protein
VSATSCEPSALASPGSASSADPIFAGGGEFAFGQTHLRTDLHSLAVWGVHTCSGTVLHFLTFWVVHSCLTIGWHTRSVT